MADAEPTTTEPDPRERKLLADLRALDAQERDRAFRIMDIVAGGAAPRCIH